MKNVITKSESSQPVGETAVYLFDDWFDPIEAGVRDRVRGIAPAGGPGRIAAPRRFCDPHSASHPSD